MTASDATCDAVESCGFPDSGAALCSTGGSDLERSDPPDSRQLLSPFTNFCHLSCVWHRRRNCCACCCRRRGLACCSFRMSRSRKSVACCLPGDFQKSGTARCSCRCCGSVVYRPDAPLRDVRALPPPSTRCAPACCSRRFRGVPGSAFQCGAWKDAVWKDAHLRAGGREYGHRRCGVKALSDG